MAHQGDVIIGAGIAGLSYAVHSPQPYVILERESGAGGYCRSFSREGFTWDFAGHFYHSRHPETLDFLLTGIDKEKIHHVEKQAQIYYKGAYIDFPFQKNIHQLPKEEFIDCLYDLFTREEQPHYDNFESMVLGRLGRGIAERFLIPYNEKLYSTPLSELDAEAMGRFFPHTDPVSIIRNFREPDANSYNATFVYPQVGVQLFIDGLVARVAPGSLHLNCGVSGIDTSAREVITEDGSRWPYRRLISTMPLDRLLQLCQIPYERDLLSANQVVVLNLGFDAPSADRANSWVYFPDRGLPFYRVGYYSNVIRSERMSLYVEVGQPAGSAVHEEELVSEVLAGLRSAGIVQDKHRLVAQQVLVMNPAYVHIRPGSEAAALRAREQLEALSIYSIGRYGSWNYSSMEDSIRQGVELSNRINA